MQKRPVTLQCLLTVMQISKFDQLLLLYSLRLSMQFYTSVPLKLVVSFCGTVELFAMQDVQLFEYIYCLIIAC